MMAYVEQDDLMYQNLTVRETLEYAAFMRLPSSYSKSEKLMRVDRIISQLGLSKCRDSRIGSPGKRGISGGERKRVSIGIELVTSPKLLFLDEPTSGLDSFTAVSIIECIKKVAEEEACAVIMTCHQPRELLMSMFDNIALMSEGKAVYFGSLVGGLDHFKSCGFTCPGNTNPSDFFLDTMTIDFRSESLRLKSVDRVQKLQTAWSQLSGVTSAPEMGDLLPKHSAPIWNNGWLCELGILLNRNFKEMLRDPATIGATLGQAVINMLILGFVFFRLDTSYEGIQNRIGALFFITTNLTFGNVMPTIALFTLERDVIKRERASGTYRASTAFVAKLLSQIPLVVVATLLFSAPVYWMVGFQVSAVRYFSFLAIGIIHAAAASILGIAISSGAPNVRVGQVIGPLVILIFLIFGGLLINLNTAPPALKWLKWISIIHHSFAAYSKNQLIGLDFGCPGPMCTSGAEAIHSFGLNTLDSMWWNVLVNSGIGAVFALVGYYLFQWKSRPLMRLK
eukprot:Partr_v1_DN28810_c2_g1_i2_m34268 putative ATP-binding cassette, subfamily G (WHITE), member 2